MDNIYLGNWADSVDETKLRENNIKYILTLNYENKHTPDNIKMFDRLGITTKYILIGDSLSDNIDSHIDEGLAFIDSAKAKAGNILVHCSMGISRSSSIVISYLIAKKNMSYTQALAFVRKIRPIVTPNRSFKEQILRRYSTF